MEIGIILTHSHICAPTAANCRHAFLRVYISVIWKSAHLELAFILCSHWRLQDGIVNNAHSKTCWSTSRTRFNLSGWNGSSYVRVDCIWIHYVVDALMHVGFLELQIFKFTTISEIISKMGYFKSVRLLSFGITRRHVYVMSDDWKKHKASWYPSHGHLNGRFMA